MRLNPDDGAAALGISTNISVDGVVPAALVGVGAQLPRWIDGPGNVLVYVNVDTTEIQTIDLDTGVITVVDTGEASRLGAGSGVWVRSRNLAGLDSNISGFADQPLAGLVDVDEDGRFAVIQAFAEDRGIVAYSALGVEAWKLDVPVSPSAVPRAKTDVVAISIAGGTWSLYRLSTGAALPFYNRSVGVVETVPLELADGTLWVIERTGDDTLTLRGATQAQGYVLSSTIVYNPDAIELSAGVIRVGWSSTSGEGPTALRMVDVTLGSGVTTDWTTASGSLVSTTGATLTMTPLALEAGAGGRELQTLLRHPISQQGSHIVTPEWQKWFNRLAFNNAQPINLDGQVTGILPVDNGGTGGNTGTSVINATNVTLGTLPQNVKWSQYDITSTGTVNNLSFASADFLRCDNATALTITGLSAGVPGQRLVVVATDADVTLADLSASSVAANQIATFTGADVTLSIDEAAFLEYDGTDDKWRLLFLSSLGAGGDVVGPASSVDGEIVLFDGVTGKLIKSATGTGVVLATSGVYSTTTPSALVENAGYWSPLTDGVVSAPELVFSLGDTISVWTPL